MKVTDENIQTAIAESNFADLQGWGFDLDIARMFATDAKVKIAEEVSFEEEKEKCQWRKEDDEWVFYLVGAIVVDVDVKLCSGTNVECKVRLATDMPLGVSSYPAMASINNG